MMDFSSTKILLISSDSKATFELSGFLMNLGYKIVGIAKSWEETIAKIRETEPDLILTDVHLNGGAEGIKTGALVLSNYDIPIVYLAESVGQETVQRARSTRPFGYILKPFDEKQIYATIETARLRYTLETELREGRRWLNAVLNGINDGVIALDNRGSISFINPIARQLTGYGEMEAIGKTLYDVFRLFDENSHEIMDVLTARQSASPKHPHSRFKGLLVSKYGKSKPVEVDITVLRDGTFQMAGFVIVFRDITEHREAMWEIQRQKQRAEALVESAARLNAELELSSVLDTICSVSNATLNASATAIFLKDAVRDVFHNAATYTQIKDLKKYDGIKFEISEDLIKSMLSEKSPVALINDIHALAGIPYLELYKEQNIHTMGVAGLYRQHALLGVLISVQVGPPTAYPDDTPGLLKGLADQAAISITNASLFEQVQKGREYQKALTTRMVDIQETERRHIAGELHDQIGQVLTGLQFMLEACKNQSGEALTQGLGETQEIVSSLIEQIREMSLNLRPPMLDDIGLLPTLLWHYERYTKQTGIKVSFHHDELPERLPPEVETAVYRIVQEALTNIARYARVTEAFVRLNLRENILGVEIVDHGAGFEPNAGLLKWSTAGLTGIRERANMLGGYLMVKSAPGVGTQILVMLPLNRKPVERRNHARNFVAG